MSAVSVYANIVSENTMTILSFLSIFIYLFTEYYGRSLIAINVLFSIYTFIFMLLVLFITGFSKSDHAIIRDFYLFAALILCVYLVIALNKVIWNMGQIEYVKYKFTYCHTLQPGHLLVQPGEKIVSHIGCNLNILLYIYSAIIFCLYSYYYASNIYVFLYIYLCIFALSNYSLCKNNLFNSISTMIIHVILVYFLGLQISTWTILSSYLYLLIIGSIYVYLYYHDISIFLFKVFNSVIFFILFVYVLLFS
jgi:hypothetical protein